MNRHTHGTHCLLSLRCAVSLIRQLTLTRIAAAFGIAVAIGTFLGVFVLHDPGQPSLAVEAKVRKAGSGPWHDVEGAWPGTLLEYHMRIRNTGSVDLSNLVVTLAAPSGVRLLADSCRLGDGSYETDCTDAWMASGVTRQALDPSHDLTVVVRARLRRRVGGALQTVLVEANSDETDPKADAVEVKPRATHAEAAVRSMYREEVSGSTLVPWRGGPQTAVRSERLLAKRWPQLNPGRLHRFADIRADRVASVGRLIHDRRLDGQIVTFVAEIGDDPTTYAGYRPDHAGTGPRLALQRFAIESDEGSGRAWCVTTRQAGHRLHDGDRILVRGLPIAWGNALSERGIVPAVSLDCIAIRRVPSPGTDDRESSENLPSVGGRGPCE